MGRTHQGKTRRPAKMTIDRPQFLTTESDEPPEKDDVADIRMLFTLQRLQEGDQLEPDHKGKLSLKVLSNL